MTTLGELADQALRVVREAREIVYDTETSGLDWRVENPIGYVITTADFNSYIPVRHKGGGNLMDANCPPLRERTDTIVVHRFERDLAAAFEERRRKGFLTIGHNLKFDMHMSANVGIILGRECEDTSINAPMLNEFQRSFSLENCCIDTGTPVKRGTQMYEHLAKLFGGKAEKDQMDHFWETAGNDPVVMEYAMGDGTATLGLVQWQRKKIIEEEMQVINRIENRLVYTVFRTERRGIRIDPTRMEEVVARVDHQLKQVRTKLPANFNPRSSTQVKQICVDAGRTDWPMTDPTERFPQGQPSLNEKFLKKFSEGQNIVKFRKLTNLGNSFITPLKERHTFKGRVHANLNQLMSDEYGTISGRFSCSAPNMQQIPKHDKELGPLFRQLFIPDEGMDFWEGDYSQCEPRLFAHYSKEPALIDGYSRNPPLDMHHVVAQAFGVERDPTAKRMNMGILTGMQIDTFAAHMGWPREQASDQFKAWFALFPGIKNFQDHVKGVFRTSGFVRTLLGRRCRLESRQFAYRGTSRVIQGGNADILKYKFLEIDEWAESEGDLLQLLMNVHDSFNWESPKGEKGEKLSKELIRMAVNVQTKPFNLRVPFVMDAGHGPNWGVATYGAEIYEKLKAGSGS